MPHRFFERKDRRHASIASIEKRRPVRHAFPGEGICKPGGRFFPRGAFLRDERGRIEPVANNAPELRFYRADRNLAAIGATITTIIGGRAAQEIFCPIKRNPVRREQADKHRQHGCDAIDDRCIDNLATPG
ncbi:MAG TPA: hypothetical protein VF442_00180, partial [Sphingobium sp.]